MKKNRTIYFSVLTLLVLLLNFGQSYAQHTFQSVLSEHTWYKMAVVQEGIYKLDYATLSAMDIDMGRLNPSQIRIFGNPSGALPEKNSETRPDDLTEMALYVSGAEDGVFDLDDYVLFYGQEPTRWKLLQSGGKVYERNRNYYSDSTFYYLCVDSGEDGLRIGSKPSASFEGATTVITEFPDFAWHEEELFSPYNIGRNWFGEMLNSQDSLLEIDFCFPNLVKERPVFVKTTLLGRSLKKAMHYDIKANDSFIANYATISALSNQDYTYGASTTQDRQILSESDTIHFSVKLYPDASGPILLLDYVELFFWRQLKCVGSLFPFRFEPNQFGNGASAIWVQNVNNENSLWDVTNPLRPMVQEGRLSANNFVFATEENTEKRYVMFEPSGTSAIASWTRIPNQNLHAIASADMLIITHPLFWEQASELARFHQQEDGLSSVVVDVKEIYNEFSSGTPDPSGIRDFIRMVYSRSRGQLKYVTLFGRTSFDYRNLKGYDRNFVPCYEEAGKSETLFENVADDFYGFMDGNEGSGLSGRVDIGIGRFPVATVEEAEAMVQKVKRYTELAANHGDWKLSSLFFSDDEKRAYIADNEKYCNIIDTICPSQNPVKVYCGAYPHVNTSSGVQIPQAHADLMNTLDKGVLMMVYSGHGGVKGLTGDNVFTVSDIAALRNGNKMPFVFTATCEFSKYDDPALVSAGEQMFLLLNDGPIAMLTTTRPTQGSNNSKLGEVLMDYIFRRDEDGHPQRFGDIVRKAKSHQNNYSSSGTNTVSLNIDFIFFGDPALRLALPEQEIVALKINGQDTNMEGIELHAMSMVSLEGEIRDVFGHPDRRFNGELWVSFFDRPTKEEVPYEGGGSMDVSFHKDILYHGRTSVNAGKFTVSFQLPKDIQLDYDTPRFGFYAYDSIRGIDAMGVFDNLTLGGIDPSVLPDNEGPQIGFYWNSPSFQNGDVSERHGVLYADLYDAQGIYHYDFSLGRDITLRSNLSAYNNMILNEYYEPALDDFRRGRIAIPVEDLDAGTFEFDLKAWDMQSNSSTAHLWFVVEDDIFLSGVRNYPNPFREETRITISHVGSGERFHVNMEVFDVMGRNVARVSQDIFPVSDDQLEPLVWDGRDQFGNLLSTGIYLYRLTLTDEEGLSRTVSQRMIISR